MIMFQSYKKMMFIIKNLIVYFISVYKNIYILYMTKDFIDVLKFF